jgi:hypothetical protein
MSTALKTFNRRVPYPVRLLLVLVVGIFLYGCAQSALATVSKFRGAAPDCTWRRTLLFGFDILRLDAWRVRSATGVSLKAQDAKFDIQQFRLEAAITGSSGLGTPRTVKSCCCICFQSTDGWQASTAEIMSSKATSCSTVGRT